MPADDLRDLLRWGLSSKPRARHIWGLWLERRWGIPRSPEERRGGLLAGEDVVADREHVLRVDGMLERLHGVHGLGGGDPVDEVLAQLADAVVVRDRAA